ncbi:linalool 8-monooxygenase [Novosphingobium kunmingense]|uniref:Linalool 8-monooxygenase n=1 Tax=Novosphingobium kunmingense TaxID=1211806 RepID=A0A2N0H648_9SPHN|nr:cytochrome P450 [Novosphingobium kunmingense]PKB14403.1 linalool 8-monooxygenase [Novosphingobium kunmingense]
MASIDLKNPDTYRAGVPYALLAQLRREDPVYWNPESDGAGFWAVLRFADIVAVSRQPDLFSSAYENGGHRIFNENEAGLAGTGESAIGIPFISRDPPGHTRYRKFVMPALSPARLQGIEQRIAQRVDALMTDLPIGEPVDILRRFTVPLPLLTLAELLGVEPERWHDLHRWTDAFIGEDDPELRTSPEDMGAILGEFMDFAIALYETRRADPGPDLASLLANAEIDGKPIPLGEFVGNLILALVGGNETTRNSLNHTMIALSRNPEQWQALRVDPALMTGAVKEMVRHASPVIHMRRTATRDTQLGGKTIRKGDKVVMFYPSGNRDEAVFADADRFDVTRKIGQHLAFGSGAHVCVGSRLAEMQLRLAFGALARQVTAFEIVGEPGRVRSNFINGFKRLDVKLVG